MFFRTFESINMVLTFSIKFSIESLHYPVLPWSYTDCLLIFDSFLLIAFVCHEANAILRSINAFGCWVHQTSFFLLGPACFFSCHTEETLLCNFRFCWNPSLPSVALLATSTAFPFSMSHFSLCSPKQWLKDYTARVIRVETLCHFPSKQN